MIALASRERAATKLHASRAWPRIRMNIDIRAAARHRRPMTVNESMTEDRAAAYIRAIAAAQDRSAFVALFEFYAPGPMAYIHLLEAWKAAGKLEGQEVKTKANA